jgi:hypothetical protein
MLGHLHECAYNCRRHSSRSFGAHCSTRKVSMHVVNIDASVAHSIQHGCHMTSHNSLYMDLYRTNSKPSAMFRPTDPPVSPSTSLQTFRAYHENYENTPEKLSCPVPSSANFAEGLELLRQAVTSSVHTLSQACDRTPEYALYRAFKNHVSAILHLTRRSPALQPARMNRSAWPSDNRTRLCTVALPNVGPFCAGRRPAVSRQFSGTFLSQLAQYLARLRYCKWRGSSTPGSRKAGLQYWSKEARKRIPEDL